MVNCQAWGPLYKAKLAERCKELMARLLDPSEARKLKEPDDYIRGQIRALRWAAEWPEQEVKEAADRDIDLTDSDDPSMSERRNRG